MTVPTAAPANACAGEAAARKTEWYARPGIVLTLLAGLVLLTALLVKTPVTGRDGDPRLSTTSTDPLGAQLFYELAGTFGFETRREVTPLVPNDSGIIFAVFDPTVEIDPTEAHQMLHHVRNGGALFVILGRGTRTLSDSLGITVNETGGTVLEHGNRSRCATPALFTRVGLWAGAAAHLYALNVPDTLRRNMQTITAVTGESARQAVSRPAVIGRSYGRGRMVVASDPDVLRNDALRDCSYGLDLDAMAALNYLRGGAGAPRTTIVFDEYHLGRGKPAGLMGVLRTYLVSTASGHTVLQVCAAGLLLLLAAATRVLPPRADLPVERRSPLEHVDALARAYAGVGATRTGTLRLVRGLQRRVGTPGKRSGSVGYDDEFLARVAEAKPALAADVALLRHSLGTTVTDAEFKEVGNAVRRIETTLTRT